MFKPELLIANTLYQHIFSKPGGVFPQVKRGMQEIYNLQPYI
jgi:hypothetical protein